MPQGRGMLHCEHCERWESINVQNENWKKLFMAKSNSFWILDGTSKWFLWPRGVKNMAQIGLGASQLDLTQLGKVQLKSITKLYTNLILIQCYRKHTNWTFEDLHDHKKSSDSMFCPRFDSGMDIFSHFHILWMCLFNINTRVNNCSSMGQKCWKIFKMGWISGRYF